MDLGYLWVGTEVLSLVWVFCWVDLDVLGLNFGGLGE